MSNSWFRLYAEFSTDPKVQMLSEAYQRRLIMLLCARCNGNVTLQDEEVTFLLRITPEEWAETKAVFLAKKFIDNDNKLLNWDKRQFRSDSSRERVARHRENKKQPCNVTVTPQNRTDTEQNRTDTNSEDKSSSLVLGCASDEGAPSSHPEKIKKAGKEKGHARGTRLTPAWDLPTEWGIWAEQQGLTTAEIIRETDKFKDYWISKAGANATKVDWEATWRNWVRKYLEDYRK